MPKLTLALRNRAAVATILGQRSAALKTRMRGVVQRSSQRVYRRAQADCPVGPDYVRKDGTVHRGGQMRREMEVTFTPAGFGYDVGWRASRFRELGDDWYVPYVLFGTRRMAGNPFLENAWRSDRRQFEAETREAIKSTFRAKSAAVGVS